MTKEIIIDGVNVTECEYFKLNRGFNCYKGKNCNETNDCYFKQCKRLQEENEKLKANKRRCAFRSLDNTFCDEAKIQIDKLKLDKDCLNVSLETARKYRGIAETDRDKYKQALEEIREAIGEKYGMADIIKIRTVLDEVLNDRD